MVNGDWISCRKSNSLTAKDYYRVLGLNRGASGKQIKFAYRKLALKYHPDRNHSQGARQKFQEITTAYNHLMSRPEPSGDEASSYEDQVAREVLRRERERMQKQARARREKKRQEEEFFNRPGRFKTSWNDVVGFIKMEQGHPSDDRCCYSRSEMANGTSYRIELLKTVDIKIRSYGALNHEAKYKNKSKKVVIPRSVRAHLFHRFSSGVKIFSLLCCLLFFPLESILWRFLSGLVAGGILSSVLLGFAGVRSRVSYLITPGLLIKVLIWLIVLFQISIVGPGFNIQTTGYVYIVVAGLIFLLDMVFDLVMGFFPFYPWLFRPLVRQGTILNSLYREGYRNYQELPVYSILFPLFKWLF